MTKKLGFELTPEEEAELALDLQGVFIDYWHQTTEPRSDGFYKYIKESEGVHWPEVMRMIDETFGSYSDLVRSLGELPKSRRTPQDEMERVFRSEVMPETWRELRDRGCPVYNTGLRKLGSHGTTMEALGVFEEYVEIVNGRQGGRNKAFKEYLEIRDRDLESLIGKVEEETGKSYSNFEIKYTVS